MRPLPRCALAAAAALAASSLASAHTCDKSPPTLRIGDHVVWWSPGQHLAVYEVLSNSNPAVASITQTNPPPGDPAENGEFRIDALGDGDTTIVVQWTGVEFTPPPIGTCEITVRVRSRSSFGSLPFSGNTPEPVNTKTGEFWMREPADLDLGGRPPLRFERSYSSAFSRQGAAGALGPNWLHSFEWRCERGGHDDAYCTIFDARGRMLRFDRQDDGSWTTQDAFERGYQLAEQAGELVLADLREHVVRRFDALGRLAAVEDPAGNRQTLTYGSSFLSEVDDGRGRLLHFSYGASGELQSVDDGARAVTFGYSGGLLGSATDPAGNVTTYEYDGAHSIPGLLTGRKLPTGETPFRQVYDSLGRVVEQSTAEGEIERYAYPAAGRFDAITPLGTTWRHEHDAGGSLTRITDAAGRLISLGPDAKGRRSSLVDRLGAATTWEWDAESGEISRFTDASGRTVRHAFGDVASGAVTFHPRESTTLADGSVQSRTFDAAGNVESFIDASGATWSYAHDASGQLTSATDPTGAADTFTWNADGTLASATDALGATTSFQYDAARRLASIVWPDGASRSWEYDARDLPTALVDELGRRTEVSYDASGRPVAIVDALGNATKLRYDENGRFHEMEDRLGGITRYTYDEKSRLVALDGPMARAFSLEWDAEDRVTRVVDGAGFATTRTWDAEGILASWTNPEGRTWSAQSDALGRITRVTSPLKRGGAVTYDARGELSGATSASGRRISIAYDAVRRPTMAVYPGGLSTEIERDARGDVTAVADATGSRRTFGWDAAGRLESATDPLGRSTTFVRDVRGRVIEAQAPEEELAFQYDAAGNLVRRAAGDGTQIDYFYDALNRLTATKDVSLSYDAGGAVERSNDLVLSRDLARRLRTIEFRPGLTITYQYDARSQVDLVTDWLGRETRFVHDPCGRVQCWTRPSGAMTTYAYDADGMLASITDTDPSGAELSFLGFLRDAEGQAFVATRRTPLPPGMPKEGVSLTFDAAHQVVQRTNLGASGPQTWDYAYDGSGRLLNDGLRSYEWSPFGRLTAIDDGLTRKTFDWDGLGTLARCTIDGTEMEFVTNYGTALPTPAIWREGGVDCWYYVALPDGRWIGAIDAMTNEWIDPHFDEAGNTLYLTNGLGEITDAWSYTPFGQVVDRLGTTENPFTFGGMYGVHGIPGTDLHLWPGGLVYDPTLARSLQPAAGIALDPVHFNPYTPVRGNPTGSPNPFMTIWQTAQNFWSSYPLFTPLDTGFIGDVATGAGEKGFERLAQRTYAQLAENLDVGKSIDGLDIGRAVRFERVAEIFGTAGNVLGAGQDFFSEATQAAEEGKGWGAIGARGAVNAGAGYVIGAASAPIALVDGATGGNFQGAIMQVYRVPETMIRTAMYGDQEYETYAQAAKDGKYTWVVQKTHVAGELIDAEVYQHGAFGAIGSFFGKFTIQGFDDSIVGLGYAFFGGPIVYEIPESVRQRWEENARSRRKANVQKESQR